MPLLKYNKEMGVIFISCSVKIQQIPCKGYFQELQTFNSEFCSVEQLHI